jgi:hypothetical protein
MSGPIKVVSLALSTFSALIRVMESIPPTVSWNPGRIS